MINGVEMITDRTAFDVERVARLRTKGLHNMTVDEISEFKSGMKGAYNYTDVNRVETACQFLAQLLYDYAVELKRLCNENGVFLDNAFVMPYNEDEIKSLHFKTDWKKGDLFGAEERQRYIHNARIICSSVIELRATFPITLDKLSYNGANTIEKTLDNVEPIATKEFLARKKNIEQAIDNTR